MKILQQVDRMNYIHTIILDQYFVQYVYHHLSKVITGEKWQHPLLFVQEILYKAKFCLTPYAYYALAHSSTFLVASGLFE